MFHRRYGSSERIGRQGEERTASCRDAVFALTVNTSVRPSPENNGHSCERSPRSAASVVTCTAGESPLAGTFQIALS